MCVSRSIITAGVSELLIRKQQMSGFWKLQMFFSWSVVRLRCFVTVSFFTFLFLSDALFSCLRGRRTMTTRVRWARNWAGFSSAWATASKTRLWRWRYSKVKNCPLKTSLGRPTPSSKSTYCLTESTNSRPKSRGKISTLTGTKPSCLKVFLVQTILSLILLNEPLTW